MLKRTLYFGNPYYLSTRLEQLIVEEREGDTRKTVPIEDIGSILIDHPQVQISPTCIHKMMANNVSVVYCDNQHLPAGVLMPLHHHYAPNARARAQLSASVVLKKQLWKRTIQDKIRNQAAVLRHFGHNDQPMQKWRRAVKSGDTENQEARASRYYWKTLFASRFPSFYRDRYGPPPNHLLNFTYAVLRAAVARALTAVGLLPVLGIHHHNQYNPFCLADDVMEPYRPMADALVLQHITGLKETDLNTELTKADKAHLLQVHYIDVRMNKQIKPLQIALERSCYSLVECFEGSRKTILYPEVCIDA